MAARRCFNAYIDESGCEGFRDLGAFSRGVQTASSEWLLVGAVVVLEEQDAERTRVVHRLREAVGRSESHKPLHWRDLRHDHAKKRRAMDILAAEPLVFCAAGIWKPGIVGRAPGLEGRKGYLYNWVSRLLVERLSWFAHKQGRSVNLLFENRASTSYEDLRRYVTAIEQHAESSIEPGSIGDVRPVAANVKGAQIADYFVSAAAEALEPTRDGHTEEDYLMRVRRRLYRPTGKDVLKYGFKLFPDPDLSRYPWLSDL